jgi:hypothetical protein
MVVLSMVVGIFVMCGGTITMNSMGVVISMVIGLRSRI